MGTGGLFTPALLFTAPEECHVEQCNRPTAGSFIQALATFCPRHPTCLLKSASSQCRVQQKNTILLQIKVRRDALFNASHRFAWQLSCYYPNRIEYNTLFSNIPCTESLYIGPNTITHRAET